MKLLPTQSFEAGHTPMIGEWLARPIWNTAGGLNVGDKLYNDIFHPTAHRLLERCDAILRLPAESVGADNDVRIAKELAMPVYTSITEIPRYSHN